MKTTYSNIPKSGFNSLMPEFETSTVVVQMRSKDRLSLSIFSIYQILAGLRLLQDYVKATAKDHVSLRWLAEPFNILTISGKLFEAALGAHADDVKSHERVVEFDVERKEVKIMLELLQMRMAHCEKQRDDRDPMFNPDTYIGQKLLLIELKEWLMLEETLVSALSRELKEEKHV